MARWAGDAEIGEVIGMPETNVASVVNNGKRPRSPWVRRVMVLLAIGVVAAVFVRNREALSLDSLIQQQDALQRVAVEQPVLVLGSAFLLYVAVTGLSLPGAALMTLVYGWLFGFWRAVVLVSFASTSGATISFLLSRFLLREAIQSRFTKTVELDFVYVLAHRRARHIAPIGILAKEFSSLSNCFRRKSMIRGE